MRVLKTSLSLPSFSPLLCAFASFSVSFFWLSFWHPSLSFRFLFLHPSSHLSRVLLRCSPASSAPRCVTVFLAPQLLSFVLDMPSVLEPDGPIVRLTSLLMAYRIEREVDPCCYAAEIRERNERERERKSVAIAPKRTGGERPL